MESTAQYWRPVWETLERYWKPIRKEQEGARPTSGTLLLGVIVAKLLNRLTCSVKDLCELLKRFERRGVALISVVESLNTSSAVGRPVLNIMTAVSQWEREAIGERTLTP